MKKYELTNDSIIITFNHTLYRIKALRDFGTVKKGDLGGYIEKEENLSHRNDCWVFNDAKVYDNARIYDNAIVRDNARIFGSAYVCDNAVIFGDAVVRGDADICGLANIGGHADIGGNAKITSISDYIVFKNWWSSGRYFTWTRSNNMWSVGCFYGTGEELIKKAYADSEECGREYEAVVEYVKSRFKC